MAKRMALIDADEIAYKGAFACQSSGYVVKDGDRILWRTKTKKDAIESIESNDWDIEKEVIPLDPQLGYDKIDSLISRTLRDTGSEAYRLFLSGENNFRYPLAKLVPYKSNRSEKPVNLNLMKEYFQYMGAETISFLEADDALSATQGNVPGYITVISTQDKDLRTVPGLNYNPNTRKVTTISVMEARRNFYYQILIGDPTDSIPHPKGLGPVFANKVVNDLFEREEEEVIWYDEVVEAYTTYLHKHTTVEVESETGEMMEETVWKTPWYSGEDVHNVIWEVANLLHMHRTFDEDERWERPSGKKED